MFKLIHKRVPSNAKNDILSGLTVALALVPEAVAFALLAGLNPLVGLQEDSAQLKAQKQLPREQEQVLR